jgi:hypothetical protein
MSQSASMTKSLTRMTAFFELPETPADAAPRESIEVRTLAIFEP